MTVKEKIAKAIGNKKFAWPSDTHVIPWPWYDYLTGKGDPFNRKQWEKRRYKDYRSHAVGDLVHNGNDVRARAGDRILAACGGLICFSGHVNGYGWIIVISHGDGLSTVYAHLAKEPRSKVGTQVVAGYEIGKSGKKGVDHAYASHLHIEGRYRDGEQGRKPSQIYTGWGVHDPENLWYFNIMENLA